MNIKEHYYHQNVNDMIGKAENNACKQVAGRLELIVNSNTVESNSVERRSPQRGTVCGIGFIL